MLKLVHESRFHVTNKLSDSGSLLLLHERDDIVSILDRVHPINAQQKKRVARSTHHQVALTHAPTKPPGTAVAQAEAALNRSRIASRRHSMSTLQATSSNSKTSMQLERSKKILSQIQTTREVAEQKKAEAAAGGGAGSFAASGGAHGSGQWGAPQG